jgi:hypothetical protein
MPTQEYCFKHSIHYPGSSCPRCDAEERHREILDATEQSGTEAIEEMRASAYRRANPGDYECPHCRYVSLKRNASRCPLCHGDIGIAYWADIQNSEVAAAQRQRAEWIRTAPEREATAKAAALAAARKAEAEQVAAFFKGIVGLVVGTILGGIAGFIAAFVTVFLVSIGCIISAGHCSNWNTNPNDVFNIIVGLVTVIGAVLGWKIGRE